MTEGLGIFPEVETTYRFRLADGPVVDAAGDGKVKVTQVKVTVSGPTAEEPDEYISVDVLGRKVKADGSLDQRSGRANTYAKWGVGEDYKALFLRWREAR